jgi:hypothetical protein
MHGESLPGVLSQVLAAGCMRGVSLWGMMNVFWRELLAVGEKLGTQHGEIGRSR